MRIALAMILAVLGLLLAGPASAGTLLSEAEMDHVSAAGFSWFSPFVAPAVLTVPTTLVNIPINVNTIIDTTIGVNTAIGACGYCPGTPGPVVTTSENPITKNANLQIPQVNTFLPTLSFSPTFNFGSPGSFNVTPTVVVPNVTLPNVSLPTVNFNNK